MWLILIGLLILLPACERVDPPAAAHDRAARGTRRERRPAVYDRELLFVGEMADTLLAAVLDFSAIVDSTIVRSAHAWLGRNGAWESFLETSWEMQPMRDPWRIVPHGSLRLVVGQAGEIEALLYRQTGHTLRLAPGRTVAEWSTGGGARLRLRPAELRLGGETVGGILLDVQAGRTLDPRGRALARTTPGGALARTTPGAAAARTTTGALSRADAGPGTTGTAGARHAAADIAPDTAAVLGARPERARDSAFLTGTDSLHLVLTSGPGSGETAWLRHGDRQQTFRGAALEWLATEPFQAARRDVPTAWRVVTPLGGLTGELHSIGRELYVLSEDAARPDVRGLYAVRGWIEVDDERHDVAGIVRHGQE